MFARLCSKPFAKPCKFAAYFTLGLYMDSFLRLYKEYYSVNAWTLLRPAYIGASAGASFWTWISLLLVLSAGGAILYLKPGPWATVPFGLIAWLWVAAHFRAIERTYQRFYAVHSDRLRFYGKDYQYLRYCLFKERISNGQFLGSVDDALAHVDTELQTETNAPVSSHPFFAGTVALLLGIVGGSVGAWKAEVTALTVVWLIVIVAFAYMLLSLSRTPASRLKEFRRFLLWLKADGTV